MLTDRDTMRGHVFKEADMYCLTVGDVMSNRPLRLGIEMSLADGIDAMNARAVRRAPVTDRTARSWVLSLWTICYPRSLHIAAQRQGKPDEIRSRY